MVRIHHLPPSWPIYHHVMTARGFLYSVFAVTAVFASGYWAGRHYAAPTRLSTPSPSAHPAATRPGSRVLPPVRSARTNAPSEEAAKLSVSEIAAKLRAMKEGGGWQWREAQKLLDSIAPADIPEVLALVEENPSRPSRSWVRQS